MSGICNKFLVFDLRVLVLACLTNSSLKYRGAHPCMHLKVKSRILNSILFLMGSQWRSFRTGVMWSYFLEPLTTLAALFWTFWSLHNLNYKHVINPNLTEEIKKEIEKLDLVGIWRYTHIRKNRLKWRQEKYVKFDRLDFSLITQTLLDLYTSLIRARYKSDLSPILEILKTPRSRGYENFITRWT